MKDYYQILGVPNNAHAADIKRAYRRLVVLYHPDKNPSVEAENLIKEINEAYDVLGDPQKRYSYDSQRANPDIYTITEPVSQHRDPRYRPRARRPVKSQQQEIIEMITPYYSKLVKLNRFALLISLVLMIDFILPRQQVNESFASQSCKNRGGRYSRVYCTVRTQEGSAYKIIADKTFSIADGEKISLYKSWLLREITFVKANEGEAELRSGIYGNLIFAPLLLLCCALLGFYWRENIYWTFNMAITNGLILFLTLILYFVSSV